MMLHVRENVKDNIDLVTSPVVKPEVPRDKTLS